MEQDRSTRGQKKEKEKRKKGYGTLLLRSTDPCTERREGEMTKKRNIERATRRIMKVGKAGSRWRKAGDGGDGSSWKFEIKQIVERMEATVGDGSEGKKKKKKRVITVQNIRPVLDHAWLARLQPRLYCVTL
ncbi:hypothetical protein COCNU_04G007810 [Cocos nucifera]|uniref:Uncharacterized protein n=1 Tax=Cocos nucifera TaxID=13894 RepID=A0A8K0I5X2_COCNU|nr:hypothetical protein COCNU_04G007810 [Cocos nucifera]